VLCAGVGILCNVMYTAMPDLVLSKSF